MSETKCLRSECTNKAATRGLCHSDYSTAHRLIKEGKTTWDELEKSGRALPSKRKGRPNGNTAKWFLNK